MMDGRMDGWIERRCGVVMELIRTVGIACLKPIEGFAKTVHCVHACITHVKSFNCSSVEILESARQVSTYTLPQPQPIPSKEQLARLSSPEHH